MFRNHLKIAVRTLRKNKLYSILNISGLALGMAGTILIWQYINFERSYDQFHPEWKNIYRVHTEFTTLTGQNDADAMNAAPVGPALKSELPEVKDYVRITPEYSRTVFSYNGKQAEETKLYFADSNFFQLFNYPLLYGDKKTILHDPFKIVLTKATAEHYFGTATSWNESPVGKTIQINGSRNFTVSGIVDNLPVNSHFQFNGIISFSTFPITNGDPSNEWEWNDFYTYILLNPETELTSFKKKLTDFADRHLNLIGSDEYKVYYGLQPINSIHLESNLPWEMEANGDGKTVSFLMLISILILVIAWANYINLSTARAEERSEEIGVRKIVGAGRSNLMIQFLTESFLINLIALLLASILISIGHPFMNNLAGKDINNIFDPPLTFFIIMGCVLIAGTVISGIYPAFILSGIRLTKYFNSKSSPKANLFRTGLVTFQYVVSVVLIICSIIIFRQLEFMKQADLGFSPETKMVINAPSVYQDSTQQRLFHAFRNELMHNPQVENISASSAIPGKFYLDLDSRGGIRLAGADENTAGSFTSYRIDENYFDTYGLRIIAGRDFSALSAADDRGLAVNEEALKILGLSSPQEAIGKKVRWQSDEVMLPIINVFENYHHKSLRNKYEPTILWNYIPNPLYYTIRFSGHSENSIKELVAETKQAWGEIFTKNPFQYFFFDDHYNAQYEADLRLGKTVMIFSILAIIIACLGLFGLTTFVISKRTKEIGIRKVLGADITGLVLLLTLDFLKIVGLAFLLAIPFAAMIGHKWLENFAFKITLSWWIFLVAGLIALLIAIATVSIQSLRASLAHPIESLKDE